MKSDLSGVAEVIRHHRREAARARRLALGIPTRDVIDKLSAYAAEHEQRAALIEAEMAIPTSE